MRTDPIGVVCDAITSTRPVADEYAGGESNLAYQAHYAQWQADRNVIAEYLGMEFPGFSEAVFIKATEADNRSA